MSGFPNVPSTQFCSRSPRYSLYGQLCTCPQFREAAGIPGSGVEMPIARCRGNKELYSGQWAPAASVIADPRVGLRIQWLPSSNVCSEDPRAFRLGAGVLQRTAPRPAPVDQLISGCGGEERNLELPSRDLERNTNVDT